MLYHHFRNYKCRINTNYFYKDLRVAILENEFIKISVLIDKGTDIFEFLYKPKDIDFMWLSPWGITNPLKFVPTVTSKFGNFLDYYEGGWQEVIPNFGPAVNYKDTELGNHGEVCLIPWDYQIIEDNPSKISIKFMVRTYRTPFYIEKTLTLLSNDPKLYIQERLKNEGYTDIDLMWTHHPTFGGVFLDNSTVIDVPKNRIKFVLRPENVGEYEEIKDRDIKWPIINGYSGKKVNLSKSPTIVDGNQGTDQACLADLAEGWYAVTNLNKKVGFGMKWDKKIFPFIWIWRMYGKGFKKAPWWGRVQCMALELCSSFSPIGLTKAIENKTAIKMKPQDEVSTSITVIVYERNNRVKRIDKNGNII